jgi:pilus assembly protein Flp/PilA
MTELYVRALLALTMPQERDEKGATAVEYGLMVALIAAVIVGIVYSIGQEVKTGFQTVLTELQK